MFGGVDLPCGPCGAIAVGLIFGSREGREEAKGAKGLGMAETHHPQNDKRLNASNSTVTLASFAPSRPSRAMNQLRKVTKVIVYNCCEYSGGIAT